MFRPISTLLPIILVCIIFVVLSCQSHNDTDNVAANPKDIEYTFLLHPGFTADSSIKKFKARLSLHAVIANNTQFSVNLEGLQPGKKYNIAIRNKDTSFPYSLSNQVLLSFPPLLAVDSMDNVFSNFIRTDIDSFINYYNGYLTVMYPDSTQLNDGNLLIKGFIGK